MKEQQALTLARINLQKYSFLRGLHHITDIENLPRLSNSSYIEYFDGLTYLESALLNRFYLCSSAIACTWACP